MITKLEQLKMILSVRRTLVLSDDAQSVLERALQISDEMNAWVYDPLHLLIACLESGDRDVLALSGNNIWLTAIKVRAIARTMPISDENVSEQIMDDMRRALVTAGSIASKEKSKTSVRLLAIAAGAVDSTNVKYVMRQQRTNVVEFFKALNAPEAVIYRLRY